MQYQKYFFIVLCCLFALLASNPVRAQVKTGDIAPDITLPNQLDVNQSLSSIKGNWVLLYFWVSWDPNSRTNTPNLNSIYNKYQNAPFGSARGFRLYTVSLDSDKKEWINALKVDAIPGSYNVNDFYSRYTTSYSVQKLPASFLIDANGIVRAINPSFTDIENMLNADITLGTTTAMQTYNSGASTSAPVVTSASAAKMEVVRGNAAVSRSVDTPTQYYNPPATVNTVSTQGTTYKIQIGAYKKLNLGDFYGVSNYGNVVSETADADIKRVMVGNFESKSAAVDALYRIKNEGYPDAFLVEYKNNERLRVVSKSEIQAPSVIPATATTAVSNGTTIAVPLATASIPVTDVAVYRSPDVTGNPGYTTLTPATTYSSTQFDNTNNGAGSTIISTSPPNYSISPSYTLPSSIPVYTNTSTQNSQGTYYDQTVTTYSKSPSVNTPSATQPANGMQYYTPGDTRYSNSTVTSVQPAKTTTNQPPQQSNASTNQRPGQNTTTTNPPAQPGQNVQKQPVLQQPATTQTQTAQPTQPVLDKQIDNYLQNYDYTLLDNTKSKRLKNKNKREKKKKKK